jgi:metallo-beta-lactamase family protein
MKIEFLGAAQTVTGSQHMLTVNGHKLLLECGLYQGRRKEAFERNRNLPFDVQEVEAVILSHAHIDHSGNLPNLVKNGYKGPIYTTGATAHLSNIMLLDSAHVQEMDAAYVNKKRFSTSHDAQRPGQDYPPSHDPQRAGPDSGSTQTSDREYPLSQPPKRAAHEYPPSQKAARDYVPVEPIYSLEDAAQVAQHFRTVEYDEAFEPIPGVRAKLVDAGHILGSAAVVLDIEEGGRKLRLWFSGDIGRRNLPLLRDPVLPEGADYMIMECTYGDKPHREPELAYEELREVVVRTIKRGGKVIIPAFAVGRTQELVYDFHKMMSAGELPRIPIFVDSPLAVNASDVFRQHPECFDEETREFIRNDKHHSALGFDLLTYTRSVEESKALNNRDDPMVIISASGMAEVGRIVHHLKNNIENPRNTVVIVSWQAPYTLGRRLADREKQVRIFGELYEVRAEVATIGGLSAHAGQALLVEYAEAVKAQVKQIFLVHGEGNAAEALMGKLRERGMDDGRVVYPEMGESVEI